MLIFELTPDGEQLEIHVDGEGLDLLEKKRGELRDGEKHVHLKTRAWAGSELSDEAQGENHTLLNHVKIFHW